MANTWRLQKPNWINGATADTSTSAAEVGPMSRISMLVTVGSGTINSGTVWVEGSVDGSTWVAVAGFSYTLTVNGAGMVTAPRAKDASLSLNAIDVPAVGYLRLNLVSYSGSAPVTASLVAE